jgi:hypothetical protein
MHAGSLAAADILFHDEASTAAPSYTEFQKILPRQRKRKRMKWPLSLEQRWTKLLRTARR